MRLGPSNPLIGAMLRRRCRQFGCELQVNTTNLRVQKGHKVMVLRHEQFVCVPNLAEKFDWYFSGLLPIRQGDALVLDFSQPRLQTYCDSNLQFEISGLSEEDGAFAAYTRWYSPQPGDLVFDIGAYCGVSTFHFAQLVGSSGNVVAFEPDPENYKMLLRNIERHKLSNVIPIQAAISSNTGRACFFSEGNLSSCLAKAASRSTAGTRTIVHTMRLSDAFERWGIPQLCKIDIEGAEIEVIESSMDLIRGASTQFVIDTSHVVRGIQTYSVIEKLLRDCDLEVESMDIGEMTTWARPAQSAISKEAAKLSPAA